MKKIFLLLLLCMQIAAFAQQTPQYIFTPNPIYPYTTLTSGGSNQMVFGIYDSRWQTLYYPSEFPGMPKGYITRIYFKVGDVPGSAKDTCYYPHTYIGMKNFQAREGNNDSLLYYDPDVSNLNWYQTDTVFYDSLYKIYAALTPGDWYGITLQKPFLFDTAKNFIVDLSVLRRKPLYPNPTNLSTHLNLVWAQFNNAFGNIRMYTGGSLIPTNDDILFLYNDVINIIGFDIQPLTSMPAVQAEERMSVYPNPADDKLYIKNAKENASYEISDMTGRVSQKDVIKGNEDIDISALSPGLYLLRINAQTIKVY